MRTADTITDEEIRELLASAEPGDHETRSACSMALMGLKPDKRNSRTVARYRARCAEILNARNPTTRTSEGE